MEVSGKAIVVSDVINVTDSFKKRELVITTDEQYPQSIMIEFNQDKCDLLNTVSIGQEVKVSINIGGRSWVNQQGETKYFNSIKGWRVEKLSDAQPQENQKTPANPLAEASAPATNVKEEDQEDLPF